MKKNIGTIDRFIRALAALMMVAGFFLAPLDLSLRLVLLAMGLYLGSTALASSCPMYPMLGMSTCRVPKH
jgi:hypothetical protein